MAQLEELQRKLRSSALPAAQWIEGGSNRIENPQAVSRREPKAQDACGRSAAAALRCAFAALQGPWLRCKVCTAGPTPGTGPAPATLGVKVHLLWRNKLDDPFTGDICFRGGGATSGKCTAGRHQVFEDK